MSSWVAKTKEDYIALAVQWSKKPKELAAIRRDLRAKLESSPLIDAKRFSADFEVALEAMWAEKFPAAVSSKESAATRTPVASKAKVAAPSKAPRASTLPKAGKASRK
jgi:hypothetical protein